MQGVGFGGFRVQGVGFGVLGLGFRFRIYGWVQGLGFEDIGLRFKGLGLGAGVYRATP